MRWKRWGLVSALAAALTACGGEVMEPESPALPATSANLEVGYHEMPPEGYPTQEQLDEQLAAANMTGIIPWVRVTAEAGFDATNTAWVATTLEGGRANAFNLHSEALLTRRGIPAYPVQRRDRSDNGFLIRGAPVPGVLFWVPIVKLQERITIPNSIPCDHYLQGDAVGDASLRVNGSTSGLSWFELESEQADARADAIQPPCPPPAIEMAPNAELTVGESRQASAACYGRPAEWEVLPGSIISVTRTGGLVTGLAPGSARLMVSCDGQSAYRDVIVRPPNEPLTITLEPSVLVVGGTLQATTQCYGLPPAWSSARPEHATITQDGLVTGVAVGETIIHATCGGATSLGHALYVNPADGSGASYEGGDPVECNEEDMNTDDCEYTAECWEGQQWFYYICAWWGCDWYEEWEWTEVDPEYCGEAQDDEVAASVESHAFALPPFNRTHAPPNRRAA